METKQQPKEAPKPKGPAFCLRLNTFRALSCLSVIITHIVSFSGLIGKFRSLHFAGHMAVYFFFNLSGYLLSLSLTKEVKRRVYAHKETNGEDGRRLVGGKSHQVALEVEYEASSGIKSLLSPSTWLKGIQKSLLARILGKFLWNRTWKTFPMYFGAWAVLKYFAHPGTHVETLDPNITWSQIFGLKVFPGHLWTMRIDMMFYFYVTPVFICLLYAAFKLQKKGLTQASKAAFAGIVVALLYTAIYNMVVEQSTLHPVKKKHHFTANLPPFCFGMIAGLINFALEQRWNKRQAARAQEAAIEAEPEEEQQQDDSIVGKIKRIPKSIWAFLNRNKYSIIFTAVFARVIAMNPASFSFFYPKEDTPEWQVANWHSYWYGIFILINDTRGGFWKFMHPNEKKSTVLHPSPLHKIVYYFGLWSYAIYLTHPISYDWLKLKLPKSQYETEFFVGSVIIAFFLGVVVDFVFDKLLVDKIIMGKIFKGVGKALDKKPSGGQELELAKASS